MKYAALLTLWLLFINPVARPDDANLKHTILKVFAEQYGRAAVTGMTFGDFTSSASPSFVEVLISSPMGTGSYSRRVSVSRDGKYVAESRLYSLNASTWQDECTKTARGAYGLADADSLTVGEPEDSVVIGYQKGIMTVVRSGETQQFRYYLSEDKRFLVLGSVFIDHSPEELRARFSRANGEPEVGPENAPVTIVEFTDFQCPDCARMNTILLEQILPNYENKIRVVFRDFPLPYHAWAKSAAIAGRCVYNVDSKGYLLYRSLLFQHQTEIAEGDSSKNLLDFAAQAGADRESVARCTEDKSVVSRVNSDVSDARDLQIGMTPTIYINGQAIAGYISPEDLRTIIGEILQTRLNK